MAFISNSKKFVFIHLHKCGGTSVERALAQDMQWNDIILGSTDYGEFIQRPYEKKFGMYKHSSAATVKGVVGDDLWNQYFTFALVRHPIDRMVSYYAYLKTHYLGKYRGSAIRLMYYVDQIYPLPDAFTHIPKLHDAFRWPGVTDCIKTANISDFIHSEGAWKSYGTMPQFDQLTDDKGQDVIVDHIGRLENISEDWPLICDKVGFSAKLPHSNKSKRKYKEWRKYFSLDDINFLAEKYQKDMEAFEYSI